MKKLSIVALILTIVMIFTGCQGTDSKLIDAFVKNQDIRSLESETVFNFNIEADGFDDGTQEILDNVAGIINSTNIKFNQRAIQNEEQTTSKAVADIGVKIDAMGIDMDLASIWVDVDMSEDELKLLEIFRINPLLLGLIPDGHILDKEYIVYDVNELLEEMEFPMDIFSKYTKGINDKVKDIMVNAKGKFNPGFKFINYKGKRLYYGKQQDVFEIRLDDKGFKDLLRYSVKYSMNDEDILELVKDYMDFVKNMLAKQVEDSGEGLDEKEKIDAILESWEEQVAKQEEAFDSVMDALMEIQIIGDKGIAIEYRIEDGLIVSEAGNIDLVFDLSNLEKLMNIKETELPMPIASGILNLGLNFETNILRVNDESIVVELPETNEENSFNIIELMKMEPEAVEAFH